MYAQMKPLVADLRPVRRSSRVLYTFGAALVASGLAHLVPLATSGFRWAGAVSWRKPIVFGLSVGLLLVTVGWVLDRFPDRPRLNAGLAWMLGLSSVGEVGLISIQAWRGEASHFNTLESGNALIFTLMGVMVGFMSIVLLIVFVLSLVKRPRDGLVASAIIGGMALVVLGLGVGQWLIELGNDFVARNGFVPDYVTSGAAGSPKFPHAVAFHGIQVFIVTALMLGRSRAGRSRRRSLMSVVVASYSGILLLAMTQAVLGVSATQLSPLSLATVMLAALLAMALVAVFREYLSGEVSLAPPLAHTVDR